MLNMADRDGVIWLDGEVVPTRELDSRTIGTVARGPVTEKLQSMYFDSMRGNRSQNRDWFAPVA